MAAAEDEEVAAAEAAEAAEEVAGLEFDTWLVTLLVILLVPVLRADCAMSEKAGVGGGQLERGANQRQSERQYVVRGVCGKIALSTRV